MDRGHGLHLWEADYVRRIVKLNLSSIVVAAQSAPPTFHDASSHIGFCAFTLPLTFTQSHQAADSKTSPLKRIRLFRH
jgi:hypothetical protein